MCLEECETRRVLGFGWHPLQVKLLQASRGSLSQLKGNIADQAPESSARLWGTTARLSIGQHPAATNRRRRYFPVESGRSVRHGRGMFSLTLTLSVGLAAPVHPAAREPSLGQLALHTGQGCSAAVDRRLPHFRSLGLAGRG